MDRFPKIALCQINPTVGDLRGNAAKIVEWIKNAEGQEAELIVFPELVLTGYPPKDLLLKTRFLEEQRQRLTEIAKITGDTPVIVGCVDFTPRKEVRGQNLYDLSARISEGRRLYNAAAVLRDGKVERFIHKKYLPNYDVFDEKRYFESQFWRQNPVIALRNGTNVMITICEDIWVDRILSKINWAKSDKGADLLVNISASPFYARKFQARLDLLSTRAKEAGLPLIYVNMIGGQDDLIFDGRSLVVDAGGRIVGLAKGFKEDLFVYNGEDKEVKPEIEEVGEIWHALTLGLGDYAHKNSFSKAVLGVSGGIDSALVAALASEALGPENVLGLVMPSSYTSKQSLKDALLLCNNLGIKTEPISIDPLFETYLATLKDHFAGQEPDNTEQNIQARIRGNLLMAFSNKFGYLVLATGNKSELAVGYATLYGDMSGGLAPIGDVPKTTVYALARWLNEREQTDQIPIGILERAPSAELAPDQKDADDLPPYELLDRVLELYIEENLSSKEIIAKGFDEGLVRSIISRIDHSEHKRRQAAPVLKITPRAFGFGRRMPITNRYEG
ncbi:NAD+ synthase [candidate division TA06 bacterium B3_TA06]|uniref:Glutamine-dependent NAD(+) synthetase n=1 Tax=candidate division TA06 bacterium B3_TA06 TaxID=2012487 RepID=A0A532V8U7_UNCT6|nr:MAG: NAD+ synthase [candidate division TA06 bacterium B3_TA06]